MKSPEMKNKVLAYLRFKRQYHVCATEAGPYDADVMACNDKEVVEIEIKCTKADLKRDLKKRKHKYYLAAKANQAQTPNRFFFAVPEKLVDTALEMCKELPYGVLLVKEGNMPLRTKKSFVYVKKKAKRMHDRGCSQLRLRVIKRATSELITLRAKYYGNI